MIKTKDIDIKIIFKNIKNNLGFQIDIYFYKNKRISLKNNYQTDLMTSLDIRMKSMSYNGFVSLEF